MKRTNIMSTEKEVIFEVWRDGKALMSTTSEKCIYDKDTIKAMKAAGYTIIDNRKKQTEKVPTR